MSSSGLTFIGDKPIHQHIAGFFTCLLSRLWLIVFIVLSLFFVLISLGALPIIIFHCAWNPITILQLDWDIYIETSYNKVDEM